MSKTAGGESGDCRQADRYHPHHRRRCPLSGCNRLMLSGAIRVRLAASRNQDAQYCEAMVSVQLQGTPRSKAHVEAASAVTGAQVPAPSRNGRRARARARRLLSRLSELECAAGVNGRCRRAPRFAALRACVRARARAPLNSRYYIL